ncbi:MAG: alanyl-tRNA editing protein [Spirochaetia bacterium]|jgi:alanyl-tRNA synthetase|nr:alanyl-tRNA editing protein [Spirochaetia bacterium]
MKTEPVYYKDTYQKTCKATVLAIKDEGIILDKTVFYPECGGQPGDQGTFGTWKVTDTTKDKDGTVFHHIPGFDGKIGDSYDLVLDWDHRYAYMKVHAAQHLLSGLLYHAFSIGTLSVHQGRRLLTIEIDKNEFGEDQCWHLEDLARKAILDGHPIHYLEMPRHEAEELGMRRSIKVDSDTVRIVVIDQVDEIACGGLHVANTREIEQIAYVGQEMIRGHVRLQFLVADEVTSSVHRWQQTIMQLCTLHSAKEDELVEKSRLLVSRLGDLEHKCTELEEQLAVSYLVQKGKGRNVIALDISSAPVSLKAFASGLKEEGDGAVCLVEKTDSLLRWLVFLSGRYAVLDFAEFKKNIMPLIHGKGGGRPPLWQGKGDLLPCETFLDAFVHWVTPLEQKP